MPFWIWSWLLTLVGATAIWQIGSGHRIGWVIGIVDECLWLFYAQQTHQWGFVPGSLIYIAIYVRNQRKSRDPLKRPLYARLWK